MTAQPRSNKRAFTLIEIMIVIGIIAILTTAMVTALNPVKQFQKARDAQRRSHLAVITAALEQYYADYNQYPMVGTNGIYCLTQAIVNQDSNCNGTADAGVDKYLKVMPTDPKSTNTPPYSYCYNATASRQDFILCSVTEVGDTTVPVGGLSDCNPAVNTTANGVFCLTSPF